MEQHEHHHAKKGAFGKSFYIKLHILLATALVFLASYNALQAASVSDLFDQKLAEAKEAARPAEIQLTIISAKSCGDCYDANAVVDIIESTGVNITSKRDVDFSSEEAKSLIEEYGIKKVPTVIVSGEISKSSSLSYKLKGKVEETNGAYVFTELEPPFVDASDGKIRGRISLVHLKKGDCRDCFDLTPMIDQLGEAGLRFEKQEEIDIDSAKGKELATKYAIKKVPSIIMDKEAGVYTNVMQGWSQVGSVEDDGSFVMRTANPPYYSVEEERLKGLVNLIILSDKGCDECYDAGEFHKPILKGLGVVLGRENETDSSSSDGKALIEKYGIKKLPTIILTGDVEEYPSLMSAWKDVGTVEDDGTYVFRSVELAGEPYKDLTTSKVVEPAVS